MTQPPPPPKDAPLSKLSQKYDRRIREETIGRKDPQGSGMFSAAPSLWGKGVPAPAPKRAAGWKKSPSWCGTDRHWTRGTRPTDILMTLEIKNHHKIKNGQNPQPHDEWDGSLTIRREAYNRNSERKENRTLWYMSSFGKLKVDIDKLTNVQNLHWNLRRKKIQEENKLWGDVIIIWLRKTSLSSGHVFLEIVAAKVCLYTLRWGKAGCVKYEIPMHYFYLKTQHYLILFNPQLFSLNNVILNYSNQQKSDNDLS